ncbi:MAG: hypothetical protein JW787_02915 [Sedimentisphaerales bacterium]|nr:hypothetical protein [Sedimentisphaerales bacterium]
MDIYNSMFSQAFVLNEQIASQIFETIPEHGPVILIVDADGNIWPSDSEEFHNLNVSESFLKELCKKIDDGVEPVIAQESESSFIASQLETERSKCGYIILALPKYSSESILKNINLIEMLLNQINLIARLIEKNNRFYEVQAKRHTADSFENVSLN